ncbi:MAG: MFS transporter [Chloroflexi bacterium]|nr:MFS transporter [Chloroflexota bacterium]
MVTSDVGTEYRLLHGAAFMALFCVGLYAATFGPVLPFLADDLGVSLGTAGLLLTTFFIGSISSSALVATALHGRDMRVLSIIGLVCIIGGMLGLGFAPSWETALVAAVLMGAGDGLLVASTHMMMPLTSRDVPSAMNRLNLWFAFGAVAGPIWGGVLLETTGERAWVYTGLAGVATLALAAMLFADVAVRSSPARPDHEFRLPTGSTTWVMGSVLFLYVGAEFGLGTWVSSYARASSGASVLGGALLTAGYWAALAAGRVLTGMYFARGWRAVPLLAWSLAGAGVAALALTLSSGQLMIAAAAAGAAGLFLGPVWPAVLAIASDGTAANAPAATVTMGNSGGVAIPWLQGRVLTGSGPAQGVAVTAVLCAVMLAIVSAFSRTAAVRRR